VPSTPCAGAFVGRARGANSLCFGCTAVCADTFPRVEASAIVGIAACLPWSLLKEQKLAADHRADWRCIHRRERPIWVMCWVRVLKRRALSDFAGATKLAGARAVFFVARDCRTLLRIHEPIEAKPSRIGFQQNRKSQRHRASIRTSFFLPKMGGASTTPRSHPKRRPPANAKGFCSEHGFPPAPARRITAEMPPGQICDPKATEHAIPD